MIKIIVTSVSSFSFLMYTYYITDLYIILKIFKQNHNLKLLPFLLQLPLLPLLPNPKTQDKASHFP